MTDTELGRTFREIVTNPGSHPAYHEAQIARLATDWPVLYQLIGRIV
jgi:hypothetical protein